MAYVRPTLEEINSRISADIKAKMGTQATFLRRSWIGVFGRVLAGACHLLYGYISHSIRQYFVVSADEDSIIKKASLYGITRTPASLAFGAVSFTGTADIIVPVGTVLVNAEGYRYETTTQVPLTGAPTVITVRAIDPGSAGNMEVGEKLTLESPRAGIDDEQTVSSSIQNGADLETMESLITRYTNRIQKIPQGGSKYDYFQWAKEIPNVGHVVVYVPGEISAIRKSNDFVPPVGEVWVYFTEGQTFAQPTPSRVKQVQDHLNIKKPVTATVQVFGIKRKVIPFNISVRLAPGSNIAQARIDIQNSLIDLFEEQAIPTSTVFKSQIDEAISRSTAELDHTLITPAGNVVIGIDEIGVIDPESSFTVTQTIG